MLPLLTTFLLGPPMNLARDEMVQFFPSYAWADRPDAPGAVWIQGVVWEPEPRSLTRAALVAAVRGILDVPKNSAEAARLEERVRLFLVDHERNKRVAIDVAGHELQLGTTAADGRLDTVVRPPPEVCAALAETARGHGGWLEFTARLPAEDTRHFTGQLQWIEPTGMSIISDIDDTIKDTQVLDRRAMIANTFVHEFRPVAGMAELYGWASAQGAVVHYVSNSPNQLFAPLAEFLAAHRFPRGPMHLRSFRLTEVNVFDIAAAAPQLKSATITKIVDDFPSRRFILVGDSGQHDPETYGELARRHPQHIAGIFIRLVRPRTAEETRLKTAFRDVSAPWYAYTEPHEIRSAFEQLCAVPSQK